MLPQWRRSRHRLRLRALRQTAPEANAIRQLQPSRLPVVEGRERPRMPRLKPQNPYFSWTAPSSPQCTNKLTAARGYSPADQKSGVTFNQGNGSFSGTLLVRAADDKSPNSFTIEDPGHDTVGYSANFTSYLKLGGISMGAAAAILSYRHDRISPPIDNLGYAGKRIHFDADSQLWNRLRNSCRRTDAQPGSGAWGLRHYVDQWRKRLHQPGNGHGRHQRRRRSGATAPRQCRRQYDDFVCGLCDAYRRRLQLLVRSDGHVQRRRRRGSSSGGDRHDLDDHRVLRRSRRCDRHKVRLHSQSDAHHQRRRSNNSSDGCIANQRRDANTVRVAVVRYSCPDKVRSAFDVADGGRRPVLGFAYGWGAHTRWSQSPDRRDAAFE